MYIVTPNPKQADRVHLKQAGQHCKNRSMIFIPKYHYNHIINIQIFEVCKFQGCHKFSIFAITFSRITSSSKICGFHVWAFLNKHSAHACDSIAHYLLPSLLLSRMRSKSYCLATRPFISGLMYQNCPQKIILQPTIGGAIQDKLKSGHGTTIFETTSTAAAAKVKHTIIPYKCQTSSKLQHTDVLSAQCLNMLHLFVPMLYKWYIMSAKSIQWCAACWMCGSQWNPTNWTWTKSSAFCLQEGLHSKLGEITSLLALYMTYCINKCPYLVKTINFFISLPAVLDPIIWLSLYHHLLSILIAILFYQLTFFMELNSTKDPPIIQPHCLLFRTLSFFIIVLSTIIY